MKAVVKSFKEWSKSVKLASGALPALAVALTLLYMPAFACNGNGSCENAPGQIKKVQGAPGPIAGAGIPILAIGYGLYWLVKRSRKGS
jgi:hypothetical protein